MEFSTHSIHFDLSNNEDIIDTHIQSMNNEHSIIVLTNKGHLFGQDWEGKNQKLIANISDLIDLEKETEIYCYENYIAIVNNRGVKGVVLDTNRPHWSFTLLRGDYGVHVTSYPISFFTRDNQTHIIYGTDWNLLNITNLETGKLLTPRPIPENFDDSTEGENDDNDDEDENDNEIDYFHGKLYASPNGENFVSTGWHWQPIDWMFSLNIDEFLKTFELGEISIDRPGELCSADCVFDRPLYLINNEIMAWGHNPTKYKAKAKEKSQLIIQNIKTGEVLEKIPFNYFSLEDDSDEITGKLFYDRDKHYFVTFSDTHDLTFTNKKGKEIARQNFRPNRYAPLARAALKIHPNNIEILIWSN